MNQPPEKNQRLTLLKRYGVLVLLNPIRLENIPDPWEENALHSFEQGKREAMEQASLEGDTCLRLMRPPVMTGGCQKCHGDQGYRVGEVSVRRRGGGCTYG